MKPNAIVALLFLLVIPFFAACGEDDNEQSEFADWQKKNEAYWEDLYSATKQKVSAGDNSWKIIPTWSKNSNGSLKSTDYIIAHVVSQGTGTVSPLYTDTVRVHYLGRLIPSATYSEGFVFDQSYTGEFNPKTSLPYKAAAAGFIDGFTTAVTNMHVGDRWMVYIPYQLGYGAAGSGTAIPGYSVTIFDVSLAAFYHPGATVPKWEAKPVAFFE